MEIKNQRILVTGINDMVGHHLLNMLKSMGATVSGIGDLHGDIGSLTYLENEIVRLSPNLIFHVPGHRYGIAVHSNFPGDVYYESVIIFSHLLEAARKSSVTKVINVMSNCVYPEKISTPQREQEIWDGLPEETLIPHGMARRLSIVHGNAYRIQHNIETISIVLASVFGPNDNFDPKSSQVMASMIQRFVNAANNNDHKVVCWGDGKPTREFIYVTDAVIGLINSSLYYDSPDPINIGTQNEISIKDLTNLVAKCTGYKGQIDWDSTKPNGRKRVCLDCSRMKSSLPKWDMHSIEEGISETVSWYRKISTVL
jgi:nucleoside-diphosphate-sugar epimerase